MKVDVAQKILSKNDLKANELREIYKRDGLYVLNIMSSPGSGKTSLLEAFAKLDIVKFAVIEGDLETNRDAERLKNRGIPAYQITTGDACHLEASMIENAYNMLKSSNQLENVEYLIIENVGNLVCPASYDLGANLNIVLLSTPEGDDKILKYPSMFLCADIVIVSKMDIMEHFNFSLEQVMSDLSKLNAKAKLFSVSINDVASIIKLLDYIKECKKNNFNSTYRF